MVANASLYLKTSGFQTWFESEVFGEMGSSCDEIGFDEMGSSCDETTPDSHSVGITSHAEKTKGLDASDA
ncbi:hypothetical protein FNV43_RR01208 [Rhamnella rubrinervis]|uniref:Uncharacterized protein n=1 Tax=Rhamnella rubrinervis TaxID=2594499 RepID=A0A8K0HRW3_9ROSA|nr:hypothetical protein FNV43_RR01208 [Rhamnella rubrinervis]